MNTISLANVIGFLIDDCGFDASDVARAALTHETNTVVESTDDSPVEATVTRKKRKRRNVAPSGSMKPGGEFFNAIRSSFHSFPGQSMSVSDIAKHSGHTEQRVRTVEAYLTKRGIVTRQGRLLHLTA